MSNKIKLHKGMAFLLFLFVFSYLLLRAIFTEPLHDEIATYYFYIYHGEFISKDFVFDANNHFLNSFLGYGLKRFVGDNFFLFRLPNLVAFPVFFWATFKILEPIGDKVLRFLLLSAVVMVPFIAEYFAYSRGYGLGMAFFVLGIKWVVDFIRIGKTRFFIGFLFAFWLSIFSNFIFLNPILVVIGYLAINQLIVRTKWLRFISLMLLFLISIAPFVFLLFKLKEAGALYYGSLDGLWDVTGKTLSKMVFFFDSNYMLIPMTAFLLFLLVIWSAVFWKESIKNTFQKPLTFFGFIFFGSLLLIVAIAFLLKVNYPEDRTGMYLIPLIILLFGFGLDHYQKLNSLKWILIFFPLAFLAKMSFHSSIYSPDQRMSIEFYSKVKFALTDSSSISSYHMNIWTWNFNESNAKTKSSLLTINTQDEPIYDIILGKGSTVKNKRVFEKYDTLAYNPLTSDVAFKRKTPIKRKLIHASEPTSTWADWEYVTIYESDSLSYLPKNAPFQISADFSLKTFETKSNLQFVVQLFDKENNEIDRVFYPIGLVYRNQKLNTHMKHHVAFPKLEKEIGIIKVYLWNKDLEALELKNGKCYLYDLN